MLASTQQSALMKASSNNPQVPAMPLEPYDVQQARLPSAGRHLIANYCDTSGTVVVYQAYTSAIAQAAVQYQRFTASTAYRTDRMTWIKPGFMWMMHRSGWASKPNQEHILAVHLKKAWLIDTLRSKAILSIHSSTGRTTGHEVVVQWDPDHDHLGRKLQRRAIQIGVRGTVAAEYAAGIAGPAVVKIEDITTYVGDLRNNVMRQLQASADEPLEGQQHPATNTTATLQQESTQAVVMGELLVPVEEIVQLDHELQAVLDMQEAACR